MKARVAFVYSLLGLAFILVSHPGTGTAQAETCWRMLDGSTEPSDTFLERES